MSPTSSSTGRRVALLFGGWTDEGHFNEIEFLYRVLTSVRYGFDPAEIIVLNHDGTANFDRTITSHVRGQTWPGDGTSYRVPVQGPGSIQALQSVFARWSGRTSEPGLSSADSVLLFVTGHGYHDWGAVGESWLRCNPHPAYFAASQLAGLVATLPPIRQLMVWLQPCHAGGFVAPILENSPAVHTAVAAACAEMNPSLGAVPARPFSPFSLAWIAAFNGTMADGQTPLPGGDPDLDGDGLISAFEAFEHARQQAPADQPIFDFHPASAQHLHLV